MPLRQRWAIALAAGVLAGCGSAISSTSTARLLTGDPVRYLVQIDDLSAPGFTVAEAARATTAAEIAGSDSSLAGALHDGGLKGAAVVRYLHAEPQLATANGPLDVISTVELLASGDGAAEAYASAVRHADAVSGAVAVSTGPLGAQAHADMLVATASDQTQVVQFTVTFRVANAVDVLVTRGRLGGTAIADALIIAGKQAARETAG
jgi:hypothetical protein